MGLRINFRSIKLLYQVPCLKAGSLPELDLYVRLN